MIWQIEDARDNLTWEFPFLFFNHNLQPNTLGVEEASLSVDDPICASMDKKDVKKTYFIDYSRRRDYF